MPWRRTSRSCSKCAPAATCRCRAPASGTSPISSRAATSSTTDPALMNTRTVRLESALEPAARLGADARVGGAAATGALKQRDYTPGATGPLHGLRILDLSRLFAGNVLTQI